MVYPSYYKDNSFHSRKNRYTYTYRHRNNSNNISNNNNNLYLNNTSRYNNDNNIKFHNSLSSPNLNTNQSNNNTSNSSGSGSGNEVCGNDSLTGIRKSRYQPYSSKSLQNFKSRYNVDNSNDYTAINKTVSKSRYDPTNKTLQHSLLYNSNNSFYKRKFERYQTPLTLSNYYCYNNNNTPSSFNQYKRLHRSTVYKKISNNNNNYTNPNRISRFPTSSSITHSYVKPQAKRIHHAHNLTITKDSPSIKSTKFVFKQAARIKSNTSISDSLNLDNNNDNNNDNDNSGSSSNNILLDKENSIPLSESDNDTVEDNSINNNTYDQLNDYEHINDPVLLKTKLSDLNYQNEVSSYPEGISTNNKYIFPLNRLQNKLWYLKHRLNFEKCNDGTREEKFITSLSQYPFYQKNINDTSPVQTCINWLLNKKCLQLKTHLMIKKHQYKLYQSWIKQCENEELFDETRKQKHRQYNTNFGANDDDDNDNDNDDTRNIGNDTTISSITLSRQNHINRADYVNDDELEDIMCQIDPGYRFNKQAARIPTMITDTIKRRDIRFVDVNNLITDKDEWAMRLITDKIDTFTKEEHDSFIKGYLRFPKKFGKISDYMGKLRSPEECVLHYYRTKKIVDYKALIKKRNMDRIKSRFKSVKKNQSNINTEETSDGAYLLDIEPMVDEDILERTYEEEMEEDEDEEIMEEEDSLDLGS